MEENKTKTEIVADRRRKADNALDQQVGGAHYREMAFQPVEFIQGNGLGFIEGNIIKYACRHQRKGKAEDVRKIIHYARLLLQFEYGEKA